jgi:hypothetical protein
MPALNIMRLKNTETPTFAGSSGNKPNVVESLTIVDNLDAVLATFTKDVSGTLVHDLPMSSIVTATATELNQLNDVSAYQESVIAAGALSVTKVYTGLSLVGAGAVTLAAPSATMLGQLKTIEMIADNGDVTLALTNVVGQSSGTTATFNDAGDKLILLAAYDKWVVIKEHGITLG